MHQLLAAKIDSRPAQVRVKHPKLPMQRSAPLCRLEMDAWFQFVCSRGGTFQFSVCSVPIQIVFKHVRPLSSHLHTNHALDRIYIK